MSSQQVLFQSEQHPLVAERFETLEEYCLSLLHLKAYETAAELARGKRVLDLGCNNGYGTELIARHAVRVTGVDVSLRSIEAARARCPGIEFLLVDGTTLPFPDASFDAVFSFQVIEHIDDPLPYLNEIRRVLAPSGFVTFTTPNREIRLDPGMKPWNEFHVREYSGEELRELLRGVFDQIEVRSLRASPELAEIELARVRRARFLAASERRSKMAGNLLRPLGRMRRRLLRAALELALVRGLRERKYRRFSTRDLHYETGTRADALDLMAICHR